MNAVSMKHTHLNSKLSLGIKFDADTKRSKYCIWCPRSRELYLNQREDMSLDM